MDFIIRELLFFSNWKIILLTGAVLVVFYLFVGMFGNYLLSNKNLFQPHNVLNSRFNYTAQKAFEILSSYDSKEKDVLMKFTYPCDFVIAVLYGFFLTIALFGIYKNIMNGGYLLLIFTCPMLASMCNIAESVQILYMLQNIDKTVIYNTAKITNIFTAVKLVLLQGSMAAIIIGLIILPVKKIILKV